MKRRIAMFLAGLFLIAVVAAIFFNRSVLPHDSVATYVGGQTCIECHQKEVDAFHGSHHDLAMDVASKSTVLANFDGTKIEHHGITSTVFMDGNRFMVNTEGPNGQKQDFEVKMVFGCEPLQQYMVELKEPGEPGTHGQYQVLRLSWDTKNQQWFYLNPPDVYERLEPDDPLHWTGISQRWNTNCAVCHSTNLKKNFDSLTGKYSTTFTDIDVNCESCHGPGSLHVKIAKNRRFAWDKNLGFGLVNNMKTNSNIPQVETCAPCHSRRSEICSEYQPGQKFDNHFACQLISSQIYHDDGQIRDEDYVYGSFIQSKMFHQGIKCTDCHDPHSTKVKFTDNRLCTSCHQHPAGKYDSPSHHRHKIGSSGASCVECHMPSTVYMAVDARRDHSIRVPRPDLSVKFGTPNACTACHIDKENLPVDQKQNLNQYLDWISEAESGNSEIASELQKVDQQMADAFLKWYPESPTNPKRSAYYEQLAIGKSTNDSDLLLKLATEKQNPAIFRASALESMAQAADEISDQDLLTVLKDQDPKVLVASLALVDSKIANLISKVAYAGSPRINRKMERLIDLIGPLLRNESRLVRIGAARSLAAIPNPLRANASFSDAHYQKALSEYKDSLRIGNDTASNHMILAGIFESERKVEQAESAYRSAISVEPNFSGPRSNLAAILERRVDQLRDEIIRSPRSKENISRGASIDKLIAEANKLRVQENALLKKDVSRAAGLPGAHNLYYQYGLSCYLMGDQELAEQYLRKAQQMQQENETYLLGLATFYQQKSDFESSIPLIKKLLELDPKNLGYQRLRDEALQGIDQQNSGN